MDLTPEAKCATVYSVMNKFIFTEEELPQRSQGWHDARKMIVGASDVATVLNLMNRFEKPKSLWKRKLGKLKPKKENDAMRRGAEMEDMAGVVISSELETNWGIKNPKLDKYFAIHPEHRFLGVSFDGVDLENKFITEIKCPQKVWNFRKIFEDGIPDHYYPQVQMQLHVANALWGITKAYFCSYYPDGAYIVDRVEFMEHHKTLVIIDIDYNEAYCQKVIKVLWTFHRFLEEGKWDDDEFLAVLKEFEGAEC